MRIHLHALGCRLNEAELETWARQFKAGGHGIVAGPDAADVVVLNTCAVTQEAVRKSRQLIKRAHQANPAARLVVSGCYASLEPDSAAEALGVDLVVENHDKDRLVEITARELDLPLMPAIATEPGETSLFTRGRHRAFIKVQDGCRYRCTFCIVTRARGEERSRPIADIVEEINALVAQGVQEAALTGVHVGGYGSDLDTDLHALIRTILAETDLPRLRLASVEPWDLPEDFFTLFDDPRLMPHMHLPLQSGADTVLRRMARRCKTAEFERLVTEARTRIPGFNVTTDIIVGFPGETATEWAETLGFVERIGFGHLHIFAYSPREGTKAATLPDRVDKATQKARSRELHELGATLRRQMLAAMIGNEAEVLWERPRRTDMPGHAVYTGYTPNFLRVEMPGPVEWDLENRITRVRLTALSTTEDALVGAPT
ncbi:MAG TPA: tRNA (N(6)-L-threonylcarbamoyladenosine(37)-C(2))-methylthiotransferase MtaB [Thioalkalivibrio sp.]|nr:tRNA (N(6)-L-threonylcarbamoyladenosine(37)-C(2))-methylthiotransferase MtaB [Thioalkalivibrio sp.]